MLKIKDNVDLIIIVLMLTLPIIFIISLENGNYRITEIQVKDKYVKGSYGEYMIVDTNNETYRIRIIVKDKGNDEIYNEIEIGKKYQIETKGKRIPKFNAFKTIYTIKELKESDK